MASVKRQRTAHNLRLSEKKDDSTARREILAILQKRRLDQADIKRLRELGYDG